MQQLIACPICGSTDIVHSYDGRTKRDDADPAVWSVFDCKSCGHGFVNPQPSWSELQRYYGADYEPYEADHAAGSAERDVEEAREAGVLRSIPIRPGLRVMDVGCGGGAFLTRAEMLGAEVQGVEPSDHGFATCSGKGLRVFHGQIDAFVAAHPDRKFDVVTSNHVVEHHPSPVEMLRDMSRALAKDGYVWFCVPNGATRAARVLKWRWHSTDLPVHLMQFTPGSVRKMVELAGLEVRRIYTATMPVAVRQSLIEELRYHYFIPQRLSRFLPLNGLSARMARDMDRAIEGEAIIVEAVLPAAAV